MGVGSPDGRAVICVFLTLADLRVTGPEVARVGGTPPPTHDAPAARPPEVQRRLDTAVVISASAWWHDLAVDLEDRLRRYAEMIRAKACDLGMATPSASVVAALRAVPRHRFLERFYAPPRDPLRNERSMTEYVVDQASPNETVLDMVYSDQALITWVDEEGRPTSSTSQPSLVAAMLELLEASMSSDPPP